MADQSTIDARLEAVDGWLALGMPLEAWAELDELPPEDRAHPQVLAVRVHLFLLFRRDDDALRLIRPLVAALPNIAELHLLAARAFARTSDLEAAREHIATATGLSPEIRAKILACEDLRAVWS